VPMPDISKKKERVVLQGDVPSPVNPPSGCTFHPRCAYREPLCDQTEPPLDFSGDGHGVSCHVFGPIKRA
jgi:oligopeptide/dipeptide ABC transporter ATP-binding protein